MGPGMMLPLLPSLRRQKAFEVGDRRVMRDALGMAVMTVAGVTANVAYDIINEAIPFGEEALLDTQEGFWIAYGDALMAAQRRRAN